MTPDHDGGAPVTDTSLDWEHLADLARQLRDDDDFAHWLRALVHKDSPLSYQIVSTTTEIAVLQEQLRAMSETRDHRFPGRSSPLSRQHSSEYSRKLDMVRTAALLSDEAVVTFQGLLTCRDNRMVEAAMLAMGRDLAKHFRHRLEELAEQDDSPTIRRLATTLLTDEHAEI